MDLARKSATVLTGVVFLMLLACASPPPKPLTHEQYLANRERAVWKAVVAAQNAGQDGAAVYARLELLGCYHDAQVLPDVTQRAPAVQQCRVTWPQPVQQQQQIVNTNCYSVNGNTQCTSQ